jgi:predicted porin
VISAIASRVKKVCGTPYGPAALLVAALGVAGVAQAQTAAPATTGTAPAAPAAPPKSDGSLTWNGITFYGIIDVGIQYQTHGAPVSDYFPAGSASPIQKYSNGSITAMTPSNLSQSRLGLSGIEPIGGDWSAVFRLETFFNPQSGNLSDALKSITLNNGRPLAEQSVNVDSSVAGQLFAGAAYAGFSSKSLGTLTFGRHVTPLADGVAKYDPMGASQAFSLIGFSGTTAGGGDTEDRRLDNSIKYTGTFSPIHLGALYQIGGQRGAANSAVQVDLGLEIAGLSADAYYAKKRDAIAAAPLSKAQIVGTPATPTTPAVPGIIELGYSPSNTVAATVSDNTTYALMALYNFGGPKIYAGFENIKFENPQNPLNVGSLTIGGYVLGVVNNTAFTNNKTLKVFWAGVKVPLSDMIDITASFYGYKQDAFAGGANAGCSSTVVAQCSGTENTGSLVLDYKFSKRFDWYIGTFYSSVTDGLASGFLNKNTLTSTTGIRFRF